MLRSAGEKCQERRFDTPARARLTSRAVTPSFRSGDSPEGAGRRPAGVTQPRYAPAIEVTRGPVVESIHSAAIAVADSTGRVTARLGGIDHTIYLRSSAKVFQAMAVVESGAVEKFALTARDLAIMTGSHGSEAIHVGAVSAILEKIGMSVSDLKCGTHVPFNRAVAEEHLVAGRPLTALEHNCSGKHSGMLAAALSGGHDPRTYLEPSHPVQQRVLGILADLTGRIRDRITIAVDGCGAPTFGVSLEDAARAFARVMAPEALDGRHRDAARRVVSAVREYPELVAGSGMMDTELSAYSRHNLISKRGAEGVQCAGFVRDGSAGGIAAKIADGNNARARTALIMEILRQLDLMTESDLAALTEASTLVVRNDCGREVGRVRPAFKLQSM